MWTTPPNAAASDRWPAGRDEIRIHEDDLDAWVTRKMAAGV